MLGWLLFAMYYHLQSDSSSTCTAKGASLVPGLLHILVRNTLCLGQLLFALRSLCSQAASVEFCLAACLVL